MLQVLDAGFHPDDRIGNYRVERELGPTGSGLLLLARHMVLPRRAIIKVVHAAFAAVKPFVVQTLREACILEAIAHPAVPVVYESGVLPERRPWFAFERIGGPTLEELLAPGPLAPGEVAALIRDLADVLEHAHRRGVIHRGLRPDRVVITADRRYPLCVPDWSEAIAHDATAHLPQATPNGSRSYVAPELAHQGALGTQELVDDRVDVFALGAIAYRALTGRPPFAAAPDSEPYTPAHELRPDAPPELAALIDTLLAFDRFDRPSASEVRADVDWLFASLPALQHRAALGIESPPVGDGGVREEARADQPRTRRQKWTPEVHFVESTDVDIKVVAGDQVKE
jgi:eukaryotic-like serine/threonine-protein kinase